MIWKCSNIVSSHAAVGNAFVTGRRRMRKSLFVSLSWKGKGRWKTTRERVFDRRSNQSFVDNYCVVLLFSLHIFAFTCRSDQRAFRPAATSYIIRQWSDFFPKIISPNVAVGNDFVTGRRRRKESLFVFLFWWTVKGRWELHGNGSLILPPTDVVFDIGGMSPQANDFSLLW